MKKIDLKVTAYKVYSKTVYITVYILKYIKELIFVVKTFPNKNKFRV